MHISHLTLRVLGRQEENHFGDWADLELLGRTVPRGQLGCRAWERTSTDEMAKTDGCVGYGCGRMCKSPRSVTDVPQYYFAVRVVGDVVHLLRNCLCDFDSQDRCARF